MAAAPVRSQRLRAEGQPTRSRSFHPSPDGAKFEQPGASAPGTESNQLFPPWRADTSCLQFPAWLARPKSGITLGRFCRAVPSRAVALAVEID